MDATPTTSNLLTRLISFDTTSRNSNKALIEFVADFLDGFGIKPTLLFSEDGSKANLFATVGNAEVPGVMLAGHTDVVPVDGQDWHSDPFRALSRDGSIFGRGTCDMKGFIASTLALVAGTSWQRMKTPLHLAFTYDEEAGCIGGKQLAKYLAGLEVRPRACIVGEPTGMKVATRHKGKKWYRCHVRGCEGHSSAPDAGVNAIDAAASVVLAVRDAYEKIKDQGPYDSTFRPPHTTLLTGLIHGGTSYNIVPRDCEFDFEIRHLPEHQPDAIFESLQRYVSDVVLPPLKQRSSDANVEFSLISEYPGLSTDDTDPVTNFIRDCLGSGELTRIGYSCEAGLFQEVGVTSVVCGPGDIAQAHKPNEFVTLKQLDLCDQFLRALRYRCEESQDPFTVQR